MAQANQGGPSSVPEQIDWVSAIALSCEVSHAQAAEALRLCGGDIEDACERLTVSGTMEDDEVNEQSSAGQGHAADNALLEGIRSVADTCGVSDVVARDALEMSEHDVDMACDLIIFGHNMDVDIARVQAVNEPALRHKPASSKPAVEDTDAHSTVTSELYDPVSLS
jgi:NACalpha-BTF3-like transcription factor